MKRPIIFLVYEIGDVDLQPESTVRKIIGKFAAQARNILDSEFGATEIAPQNVMTYKNSFRKNQIKSEIVLRKIFYRMFVCVNSMFVLLVNF